LEGVRGARVGDVPGAQAQISEVPTLLPTQRVTDRIWQIIVWAFAIVFVLNSLALILAVFRLEPEHVQILLTVFTTVAGILAGFISGRASSGGTSS